MNFNYYYNNKIKDKQIMIINKIINFNLILVNQNSRPNY